MATVKIKLRTNKLNKRGEAPLVIQIVHDRRSTELTLRRYMNPIYWESSDEKVIGSHPSKSALNIYLNNERRKCEGIIDDWLAPKKKFTLLDIVNAYRDNGSESKKSVGFRRCIKFSLGGGPVFRFGD